MVTALRSGQVHISVCDRADEFISVNVLGRERLLVLSCGLPSHPLKILSRPLGDDRELLSQLSTHQPPNKCVLNI